MESQGVYRQKETYNMYTATANYIHKLDKDGSVLKLVTDYISKDLHGRNQYQIFQEIGALNKDTVYRPALMPLIRSQLPICRGNNSYIRNRFSR